MLKSVTIKPVFLENLFFVTATYRDVEIYIDENTVKIKSKLSGKFIKGNEEASFSPGEYEFSI